MVEMKLSPQFIALWADMMVMATALLVFMCVGWFHSTPSRAGAAQAGPLKLANPRIEVCKSDRTLKLFDGRRLAKTYPCCIGRAAGDKEREGDHKTPEGRFCVCYKNPGSKFTRSLGLNYPNEEDAARGLRTRLITQAQHDALMEGNRLTNNFRDALQANLPGPQGVTRPDGIITVPGVDWEALWKTPLGGEVMIHGASADRTGTAGCVGLDDPDILELYEAIPLGTPVVVKP
jgi:hypothetical protein